MFSKGDVVNVYNMTFGGKPFLEGRATILASTGTEDHYRVRFVLPKGKSSNDVLGDHGYSRRGVERFVYEGEAQTDPGAFLAGMLIGAVG
jgi:hypothetical protein